ncbi:MAG: plasmid partitioning protein RepB [Proteobacteria bacterium]|nr:plasmid partitioning protein RepB [Pseudomonadota bacterium]
MARKNLLSGLTKAAVAGGGTEAAPPAAFPVRGASRGAFGAVTRTIDDLAARADAARALEARLTSGALVVDLDPGAIDRSFITDRMEPDDESYRALRASIAATGQDSPILVRPHPTEPGRFQVAFGHRRLRAAAELGRPVRSIVKPLSDRDLVIAQGQENSARADLSFIERGRFALALEEAGYDRETLMLALSIDKSGLSRLITVASRLPTDIVEAVGPAPAAGRDRWTELAAAYAAHALDRPVDPLLESDAFRAAPSDERFEMLHEHLVRAEAPAPQSAPEPPPRRPVRRTPPKPRPWISTTGEKVATVTTDEQSFVLTIDKTVARGFGEFLLSRMGNLYEEFVEGPPKKAPYRHSIQR